MNVLKDWDIERYNRAIDGRASSAGPPCPRCGHPLRNGYCYYCGTGKRPSKSPQQRAEDEARALQIWEQGVPITGTLAERYLIQHRKIRLLPPNVDGVLRFHPQCPFDYKQTVPALLALVRDINTDHRPCGVHRTPLHETLGKLGPPRAYGTFYRTAIKLWPGPDEAGRLTIGEGIETTLSFVQIKPELAPAWAVGTAGNLGAFPILDDVKQLHIAVDNDSEDRGNIGQIKAQQCGGRYGAFGIPVNYYKPKGYKDFNDYLRGD